MSVFFLQIIILIYVVLKCRVVISQQISFWLKAIQFASQTKAHYIRVYNTCETAVVWSILASHMMYANHFVHKNTIIYQKSIGSQIQMQPGTMIINIDYKLGTVDRISKIASVTIIF